MTMMRLVVLFASLAMSPAAWGHGSERQFGTTINGREPTREPAEVASDSTRSPAFTLIVLATNAKAMERAIEAGRTVEVRERAERLPELLLELKRGARQIVAPGRDGAVAAASAIDERGARVVKASHTSNPASIQRELAELRRLVASMERLLRMPGG